VNAGEVITKKRCLNERVKEGLERASLIPYARQASNCYVFGLSGGEKRRFGPPEKKQQVEIADSQTADF